MKVPEGFEKLTRFSFNYLPVQLIDFQNLPECHDEFGRIHFEKFDEDFYIVVESQTGSKAWGVILSTDVKDIFSLLGHRVSEVTREELHSHPVSEYDYFVSTIYSIEIQDIKTLMVKMKMNDFFGTNSDTN